MNKHIQAYIDLVESGTAQVCAEQLQLVKLVKTAFTVERIHVDEEQLERYMGLQILPLSPGAVGRICFYAAQLHLYGQRRAALAYIVHRGGPRAGKNGYLAFEDFALVTPINGTKHYNIDLFAMAEDQAKATFEDIYEILDGNEAYFKKFFRWTKEEIENLATKSKIRYHTSAPKTKDGGRPSS